MCMELTYENSKSKGMVDFSYLALGDKIIVNKTYSGTDEFGMLEDYGFYPNKIFIRWEDKNKAPVLTALINFDDIEQLEGSFQMDLVNMSNEGHSDELWANLLEMIQDAFANAGFYGTHIFDLLLDANERADMMFCREIDFSMHEPTSENIHPLYDT